MDEHERTYALVGLLAGLFIGGLLGMAFFPIENHKFDYTICDSGYEIECQDNISEIRTLLYKQSAYIDQLEISGVIAPEDRPFRYNI